MVKNTKGGSGHKSQARKFAGNTNTSNRATRFSQDQYEYYAQVVATLGNGMCHVMCLDTKKRLCHIRGKFRGRGKRDNTIRNGTWVLVGGRDYEAQRQSDDKKLENCDLLEVYSDLDKDRLKRIGEFSEFIARDLTFTNSVADSDIVFTTENEEEYANLVQTLPSGKIGLSTSDDEGEEKNEEKEKENDDKVNFEDI